MASSAVSGNCRSAISGLTAMTHTSPIKVPTAAGTRGPRARGVPAAAVRRLKSQMAAAVVTDNRLCTSSGRTEPAIMATAIKTTNARPVGARTARMRGVVRAAVPTELSAMGVTAAPGAGPMTSRTALRRSSVMSARHLRRAPVAHISASPRVGSTCFRRGEVCPTDQPERNRVVDLPFFRFT